MHPRLFVSARGTIGRRNFRCLSVRPSALGNNDNTACLSASVASVASVALRCGQIGGETRISQETPFHRCHPRGRE